VLVPKNAIKTLCECIGPTLALRTAVLSIQKPVPNRPLGVLGHIIINPLKELPHNSGKDATKSQMSDWRIDDSRYRYA
jgi:hypothetical protein